MWIVATHPRSGSTAMMRLLLAHGLPVTAVRGSRVLELPRGWSERQYASAADGSGVKAHYDDAANLLGCPAVRLVRDPEEVARSWAAKGHRTTRAQVEERYRLVEEAFPRAPVVRQEDLRDRPRSVVRALRSEGWPLAASEVGPPIARTLLRIEGVTIERWFCSRV